MQTYAEYTRHCRMVHEFMPIKVRIFTVVRIRSRLGAESAAWQVVVLLSQWPGATTSGDANRGIAGRAGVGEFFKGV